MFYEIKSWPVGKSWKGREGGREDGRWKEREGGRTRGMKRGASEGRESEGGVLETP